jgi:hypothetical protein
MLRINVLLKPGDSPVKLLDRHRQKSLVTQRYGMLSTSLEDEGIS